MTRRSKRNICSVDACELSSDFVVYSVYGDRHTRGVSLLVRCKLDMKVDVVHNDAEGRLIMADIPGKSGSFRVAAFHTPNDQEGRVSFFRQLGSFLME